MCHHTITRKYFCLTLHLKYGIIYWLLWNDFINKEHMPYGYNKNHPPEIWNGRSFVRFYLTSTLRIIFTKWNPRFGQINNSYHNYNLLTTIYGTFLMHNQKQFVYSSLCFTLYLCHQPFLLLQIMVNVL